MSTSGVGVGKTVTNIGTLSIGNGSGTAAIIHYQEELTLLK